MVVMATAMVKLEVVAEVVEVAAGVPTVLVAKCGCSKWCVAEAVEVPTVAVAKCGCVVVGGCGVAVVGATTLR
jgi:hypothetical protein